MAFIEKFSPEILEELGSYVYKLIDPRDGSVFYVGKGKGNRVFAHMKAALNSGDLYRDEEEISLKLKTIREIIHEQLKPLHIIHRHGLTEKEAELVEAVLIDATPGLTNIMGGIGSNDKGPASAEQIQRRYHAEMMEIDPTHRVMAINVRKSKDERSELYDAVRFAWRVSLNRANKADLVFAVANGICIDVFVPEKPWIQATKQNFPILNADIDGRYGFKGQQAPEEIRARYCGKRLPESMQRKKGMASPVLYNY